MSVRIAEYFGHNVRATTPFVVPEALTCPFSGQHCYKFPRNQPVCSVWLDGTPNRLYPVCPDRFIKSAASVNVQHTHVHAKLLEVAQCLWGAEVTAADIAVTFGKALPDGSKVDCVIRRKLEWEIAKFPNGFLVELQVSGDTSNTGNITSLVAGHATAGNLLPNGTVTGGSPLDTTVLDAGPSYGNVYKRAMMQIISKGALAMANDLGIALVVNRVFLERLKTEYKLPASEEPFKGRDIVMFIPADATPTTNAVLDMSIVPAEAVRLHWPTFIEWFSKEGVQISVGGNYSLLSGGNQTLT